eukprot:jgi/Hompol1/2431/HPOL_005997-RA
MHNWLVLNAQSFKSIVIIAYSMGGLIAVDAVRLLFGKAIVPEVPHTVQPTLSTDAPAATPATPAIPAAAEATSTSTESDIAVSQSQTETASWWSWLPSFSNLSLSGSTVELVQEETVSDQTTITETWPTEKDGKDENDSNENARDDKEKLAQSQPLSAKVNIVAILCIDTPFFGLNSVGITSAVSNAVTDWIPGSRSTNEIDRHEAVDSDSVGNIGLTIKLRYGL